MEITVTPEELLEMVQRLFPKEFDRARAELVIVKQQEQIAVLQKRLSEAEHDHSHGID